MKLKKVIKKFFIIFITLFFSFSSLNTQTTEEKFAGTCINSAKTTGLVEMLQQLIFDQNSFATELEEANNRSKQYKADNDLVAACNFDCGEDPLPGLNPETDPTAAALISTIQLMEKRRFISCQDLRILRKFALD